MDVKIFLLEPIDERNPKKKLVYSECAASARRAAAISDDPTDRIYADRDLSTCIQIDPEVLLSASIQDIKFKYNDVTYELIKDKAEDILVEVLI